MACSSHVDEGNIEEMGGGGQSVGLQCGDCSMDGGEVRIFTYVILGGSMVANARQAW